MDIFLIVLAIFATGMAAAIVAWSRGRAAGGDVAGLARAAEKLVSMQSELAGRLSQIAEQSAAAQSQLGERLQAQERALSKTLDERLGEVTKRVHEGLEKSAAQSAITLGDLRERLGIIHTAQETITKLSTQVVGLQDILSNKQARGAFGEIQLVRIVADLLPPPEYSFQATIDGRQRVDCLLHLPPPYGPLAIDAKFPLEGYRALREATDEAARIQAQRSFAASVVTHIRDIAEKYIVPGLTAEGALMFLPSEAVYAELHAGFPEVVERAHRLRVFIVSPTTLWATLNTMRAILKDVRMQEQAGLIQKEVGALLRDVVRLDERVAKLQTHFEHTTEDMRGIRISAEKVTKRAERIGEVRLEEPELPLPSVGVAAAKTSD